MARKHLLLIALLSACAQQAPILNCDQMPQCNANHRDVRLYCPGECGEPPSIDEASYWADPDPNRGEYWCMASDSYSSVRNYVAQQRAWNTCVGATIDAPTSASCLCVAPENPEGVWCEQ